MTKITDALTTPQTVDPLNGFLLCDIDDAADPSYYGYCAASGQWVIEKYSASAGTIRYVTGGSSYATAWTNRASQTYVLPGP